MEQYDLGSFHVRIDKPPYIDTGLIMHYKGQTDTLPASVDMLMDQIAPDLPPGISLPILRQRLLDVFLTYRLKSTPNANTTTALFCGRKVSLNTGWLRNGIGPIIVFNQEWVPAILVDGFDGVYRNPLTPRAPITESHYLPFCFQVYNSLNAPRFTAFSLLRTTSRYIKSEAIVAFITLALLSGLALVPAVLLSGMAAVPDYMLHRHKLLLVGVVFCYLVTLPFYSWLYSRVATRAFVKVNRDFVPTLWMRLLEINPRYWYDSVPEEVEEAFNYGIAQRQLIITVVFPVAMAVLQLVWAEIIIFKQGVRLAEYAGLFFGLKVLISLALIRLKSRAEVNSLDARKHSATLSKELVRGIGTVKAYGAEANFIKRWQAAADKRIELAARLRYSAVLVDAVSTGAFLLYSGLWLWLVLLHPGSTTLGIAGIIMVIAAFNQGLISINRIESASATISQYLIAISKLRSLLLEPRERGHGQSTPAHGITSLALKNVSFGFPDGPLLFEHVSFGLKRGEMIGIVGPSGCGKTTLLHTILGFCEPNSGQVYWNGHPLTNVDISVLRKRCGVILQGACPQGRNIREAVAGSTKCDDEEIWEVLALAAIREDVLSMPLQLSTPIGDQGSLLSGGQRQRLMIAKVLMQDPDLIILDEALSSIDTGRVNTIMNSLRRLSAAIVIVSHNVEALHGATQLLTLKASPKANNSETSVAVL